MIVVVTDTRPLPLPADARRRLLAVYIFLLGLPATVKQVRAQRADGSHRRRRQQVRCRDEAQ